MKTKDWIVEAWKNNWRLLPAISLLPTFSVIAKLIGFTKVVIWLSQHWWGPGILISVVIALVVWNERVRNASVYASIQSQRDIALSVARDEIKLLRQELEPTVSKAQALADYETSKGRLESVKRALGTVNPDSAVQPVDMTFIMLGRYLPWLGAYGINIDEIRAAGLVRKHLNPKGDFLTAEARQIKYVAEVTEVRDRLNQLVKELEEASKWPIN
jgi:hypothetical protein